MKPAARLATSGLVAILVPLHLLLLLASWSPAYLSIHKCALAPGDAVCRFALLVFTALYVGWYVALLLAALLVGAGIDAVLRLESKRARRPVAMTVGSILLACTATLSLASLAAGLSLRPVSAAGAAIDGRYFPLLFVLVGSVVAAVLLWRTARYGRGVAFVTLAVSVVGSLRGFPALSGAAAGVATAILLAKTAFLVHLLRSMKRARPGSE